MRRPVHQLRLVFGGPIADDLSVGLDSCYLVSDQQEGFLGSGDTRIGAQERLPLEPQRPPLTEIEQNVVDSVVKLMPSAAAGCTWSERDWCMTSCCRQWRL